MRKLLATGVAALAMAATPVLANGGPDPLLTTGITLFACVASGAFSGAGQVQCAVNDINGHWHHSGPTASGPTSYGSNGNTQTVVQTETASFPHAWGVYGPKQVQVTGNIVDNGSGNTQGTSQTATLTDNTHWAGENVDQVQGSLNLVTNGNDNTQSITQSATMTIGGDHHHHNGPSS